MPARAAYPPSLGWMLLLAAALFALVLPIIGPLDDHHFAERSHSHDHIYLNGATVAHHHAYERLALHAHRESEPQLSQSAGWQQAQSAGWQQEGDVLYLTPAAAGITLAALNAPYHPAPESLRPPPPSSDAANLLERIAPESGRPRGETIPPPLPPPIT